MKYYLHDSNAFQDEKITELFMEFGYEGLGLFYTILEKLAMQEKPIKTDVLKMQLFVGRKLERCWKFLESSGLISSNNGETFNENLLKFSEKYQVKKDKNRERITEWRKNQALADDVTRYNDVTERVRNSPKDNISKVNKSKVKGKAHSDECDPSTNDGFEFLEKAKVQVGNTSLNAPLKKASHTGGAAGAELEANHSRLFTDAYCEFYEQRVGVKPDFTKADGVAAAGLRKFLKDNCHEKTEEGALNSLRFIFLNWDKLEPFYQDQLKLSQIKSNINNIMNQVKNGTAKKQPGNQKPNGTKPSFAGVGAIVDFMSEQSRFT